MAKKVIIKEEPVRDLEGLVRDLISAMLEGFNVKTQEDYEEKESNVLDEIENLKEDLETYLLEAIDELPNGDSDLDFEDEDENAELEDVDEDL